jgi:hypothetical protein
VRLQSPQCCRDNIGVSLGEQAAKLSLSPQLERAGVVEEDDREHEAKG